MNIYSQYTLPLSNQIFSLNNCVPTTLNLFLRQNIVTLKMVIYNNPTKL